MYRYAGTKGKGEVPKPCVRVRRLDEAPMTSGGCEGVVRVKETRGLD